MRYATILLFALAAAALAGWQAETRAGLEQRLLLRALAAQLEPYGRLSHVRAKAHFWGSGDIESLRFAPHAAWQQRHGLPADFALHIPHLRYRDWQQGTLWPASLHLRFEAATLPLPSPWPQSARGEINWQYAAETGALNLRLLLEAPRHAAATADLALRLASPEQLRGATLLRGQLHYRDLGLAQAQRAALAARLGADPQNADQALASHLVQWLTARGLPPDAALANVMHRFAREPRQLILRLDPPGALRPETLPQFAPQDRAAALGLSARTE